LSGAPALRVGPALLETRGTGVERYWLMAVGGVLAIVAVGFFGLTVLRAARGRKDGIVLHERVMP
jgi:hypothetical protein